VKPLLSDEHFSVDGTLIEAKAIRDGSRSAIISASFKSFKSKDGSDESDGSNFHKRKRKPTKRMPSPPIRTATCIARRRAARPSFALWAMR
jgi:hypothetical protein